MNISSQIRRHVAAAWRHRWKALALSWLIFAIGWAGVGAIPDQYRSTARVYADADAVLSTLLRGIAIDSTAGREVELLQRTLLSRPNLEQIVARTDLDKRVTSAASREGLLAALAKDIRLAPQTRNLFTLEYRDTDPRMAKDVVQAALNLFIELAAGTDRQGIENAQGFLLQQIASYEVRLREAERRRAEFQSRNVDILPDPNGGLSRLESARARVRQVQGDLQDARTRRELTRQQLTAQPAMIAAGTEGGGNGRAAELERELREMRLRMTDAHPDVRAAQQALAAARAGGGGGGGRAVMRANPLHEQLQIRMVDADSQVASLERQMQDANSELERLDAKAREQPEVQAQFTNLDRDYNVLRRNYEELLARRESISLADAARTGSDRVKLEVVDPPTVPNLPVSPNRPLLLAGVLVAGLGAGVVLALLLSQLDSGFYTVHDLRRLDVPVLGRISAQQPRLAPRVLSTAAFGAACAVLLVAFAAAIAGPSILAHAPEFIARAFA
ncbi:XrtA system polysaccharide chain length determinant [Muricoccus vinaceus]|uniref:XrtA system polysaccharide chain length determinant n=1 Tax=Muricoccus vinaceus TaxID=424704 RepID=A0ABV6INA1_9PROT